MWVLVAWLVLSYVSYMVIELMEARRTGSFSMYFFSGGDGHSNATPQIKTSEREEEL